MIYRICFDSCESLPNLRLLMSIKEYFKNTISQYHIKWRSQTMLARRGRYVATENVNSMQIFS
jgi:hypothetical protein